MQSDIEQEFAWLGASELESARSRLPILHINVVPVRVDSQGEVTHVGLLLRGREDGQISRSIISGRVMYGERVREAVIRHIEKDLGPVAFPRIPQSLVPFDVIEYFPDPAVSGYHDPRQHAVALAYVVAVTGDCQPSQDSLDLVWFDLAEASSEIIRSEMSDGHDRVVRGALSHVGRLL